MAFNTTAEIIDDIRAGKMVVLMDDEDRENEGDLVMAATHVRPEDINFMITHARGLVCLTITADRSEQLNLPLMSDKNGAKFSTNFTVSIEAAEGVTTGISAADRARTIQTAVSSTAKPEDIVQPGHVFPIVAQNGGVLHRAGHTEAGCDLTRLAGLEPAAVICEIIKEDGEMARRDDLEIFAKEHGLKIGTIADLINYRIANEQTVEMVATYPMQTEFGEFTAYRFKEKNSEDTHLALVKGNPQEGVSTVRVCIASSHCAIYSLCSYPTAVRVTGISMPHSKKLANQSVACLSGLGISKRLIWAKRSITLSLTNPTHRLNTNLTAALGLAHRFYVIWACVICVCCHHRLNSTRYQDLT